jgi:hypothetical protein
MDANLIEITLKGDSNGERNIIQLEDQLSYGIFNLVNANSL